MARHAVKVRVLVVLTRIVRVIEALLRAGRAEQCVHVNRSRQSFTSIVHVNRSRQSFTSIVHVNRRQELVLLVLLCIYIKSSVSMKRLVVFQYKPIIFRSKRIIFQSGIMFQLKFIIFRTAHHNEHGALQSRSDRPLHFRRFRPRPRPKNSSRSRSKNPKLAMFQLSIVLLNRKSIENIS